MPISQRTAAGDLALDNVLDGRPPASDAPAWLLAAAAVVRALTAAPSAGELAAEPGALAAFRGGIGVPHEPARSRLRRLPMLGSLFSVKLGLAAAAVALSGSAVAAYTGALPASVQQLAHNTIGAPAAQPTPSATPSSSVTPGLPGHSAYGLCTAYAHVQAHGSARQKAKAFRNLADAAGGAANVSTYCAAVPRPSSTSGGSPAGLPSQAPTAHPTGQPASLPTSAAHATGKPTSHPTSHPTGQPTGKPTGNG